MINRRYSYVYLIGLLVVLCTACEPTKDLVKTNDKEEEVRLPQGVLLEKEVSDYFSFFPSASEGKIDGKVFYFEPSAVLKVGEEFYIASDNKYPEDGQYYIFKLEENKLTVKNILINENRRVLPSVSDVTRIPNSDYAVATTHFRAFEDGKPATYDENYMIYWKLGEENKYQVIDPAGVTKESDVEISYPIREKLIKAVLKHENLSIKEFEVGAIHFMPDNQMLIAVNITDNFGDVHSKILESKFSMAPNGTPAFASFYNVIKDFDISDYTDVEQNQYIVDLDYDRLNNRLIVLTAYKTSNTDEGVGGFMWFYDRNDLFRGGSPILGIQEDQSPMLFQHKPSGLTFIDNESILVIFDDDDITGSVNVINPNTQFSRRLHQASYTVLRFIKNN